MNNKPLALIVEDEDGICGFISAVLSSNEFLAIKATTGKEAISLASSRCPDIILLDLGLPDMDGLDVLKTLRKWTALPVIVVSARGHERDKVEALDAGADDYITKPFGTAELLARMRTAMRHSGAAAETGYPEDGVISTGELQIDYGKRLVTVGGNDVHLTPIEYKIVALLTKYIGKVLTHDFIIREIWGPFTGETYSSEVQALRVNMANIRRKLEKNPAMPRYIVTEVGVGYRMTED